MDVLGWIKLNGTGNRKWNYKDYFKVSKTMATVIKLVFQAGNLLFVKVRSLISEPASNILHDFVVREKKRTAMLFSADQR